MNKEHFQLICEQFNVDQYWYGNSDWYTSYDNLSIANLEIKQSKTGATTSSIVGRGKYITLLVSLPLQTAENILRTIKETEILFL